MNNREKDRKLIWHPFSANPGKMEFPELVKAEGAYIFLEDNTSLLDMISSWWVTIHGHAHPYIAQKVYEQFLKYEHVIFAGFTHPIAVELAERLMEKLPSNQERIFFSDNGSTAVEVGLKMAIQYAANQGRTGGAIIAFEDAYHGDTFGAMAVGDRSVFTRPFHDRLFDVTFIPAPIPGKEEQSISAFKKALKNDPLAFIFEPLVQGAGGMKMYETEPLMELMKLCRKHDIVTIADEVMTGFYRTGRFFASEYLAPFQPDIMSMSKGITGGVMPLGVTSCSTQIVDAFRSDDADKTFFHGHSFTGNPLSCAASVASLDLFEKAETIQNIQTISDFHAVLCNELKENSVVDNVRNRGTILAVECKTQAEAGYLNNLRDRAIPFFKNEGVLIRPLGNVLYFLPPYCLTLDELNHCKDVLIRFLEEERNLLG